MARSLAAKLNVLESAIVRGEDSVEDARWGQAREVVRLIDAGHTQREIAAEWINGRTDKPYDHGHVGVYARVWRRFGGLSPQDQPQWTTAEATVKAASDEVVTTTEVQRQVHEARSPTTVASAEKLVQNITAKASPEVQDAVYHGLREARAGQYLEPKARERRRKEAEATADNIVEPIRDALAPLGASRVIALIEEATERLQEAGPRFSEEQRDDIGRAIDGLVHEFSLINEEAMR